MLDNFGRILNLTSCQIFFLLNFKMGFRYLVFTVWAKRGNEFTEPKFYQNIFFINIFFPNSF